MTNIASNLTFYRKRSGLTQGQLGELLHVSAQAISKWETGQAEPGLDMVARLAEIYLGPAYETVRDTVYATIGEFPLS